MLAWIKGMRACELMVVNSVYPPYEAIIVKSLTLNKSMN